MAARTSVLSRFDDGISSTTITYLLHAQMPHTDFYEPYGVGFGVPGLLPRIAGLEGIFAERLTYAVFPALVTVLATVFVWKRCGPLLGLLVGLLTFSSNVARYSMAWAAVLAFALLVDGAVQRSAGRNLREAAAQQTNLLIVASAVLSLAAWARFEYTAFALVWAAILYLALPPGRPRVLLPGVTTALALLPTLLVTVTGGLRHLWWFASYTLSTSDSGFRAQRGMDIDWSLLPDRVSELARGHLDSGDPGAVVASYGVACLVLVAAALALARPGGRERVLRADATLLTPFFLVIAALVLYGQLARFSAAYGLIAVPVFWVAGALLVRRLPAWGIAGVTLLVAWPLMVDQMPDRLLDRWDARPDTEQREGIRGLNRIPLQDDGGAESMAALVTVWKQLGFDGRPTLSIGLRNDFTWVNDAIVGYLLDAPPAGWPMAYDPGLANQDRVQREVVDDLCRNRAPVVQLNYVHPYPASATGWTGSRRLDEFLAVNYRVRAVAGFYRILVPALAARCVMPSSLDSAALAELRDAAIDRGEQSAAGALAIAHMEAMRRAARSIDADDMATAALGGYGPTHDEVPPGPLGVSTRTLVDNRGRPGLALAASLRWPSEIQALAAQTAWVRHRDPAEPHDRAAVARVAALAVARPRWAQAIANARTVMPTSPKLLRRLARAGTRGVPDFDVWRRDTAVQAKDIEEALRAGLDLVADFDRAHNPVRAGHAEIDLTLLPGLEPGCVLLLRRHADARPGVWVPSQPGDAVCPRPAIARLAGA